MNRRRFLTAGAAAALSGLAGCLDSGRQPASSDESPGEPTDDPTDTPSDEPTDTPSATPSSPELTDSSFTVTDVSCGGQGTDSQVTIGDDRVTVEGTVDGSNGCYSAELAGGEYDDGEDTLFVEVVAVEGEGDVCTQCITEVDYTATFRFDGAEPGTVHLTQHGAFSSSESETSSGSATPDGTQTSDAGSDY